MDITEAVNTLMGNLDQVIETDQEDLESIEGKVGQTSIELLASLETSAVTVNRQLSGQGTLKVSRSRDLLKDKVDQVKGKIHNFTLSTPEQFKQLSHIETELDQCVKTLYAIQNPYETLENFIEETQQKIGIGPSPAEVLGLQVLAREKLNHLNTTGEADAKEYIEKLEILLKQLKVYEKFDNKINELEEALQEGAIPFDEMAPTKAQIEYFRNILKENNPGPENQRRQEKLTKLSIKLSTDN